MNYHTGTGKNIRGARDRERQRERWRGEKGKDKEGGRERGRWGESTLVVEI